MDFRRVGVGAMFTTLRVGSLLPLRDRVERGLGMNVNPHVAADTAAHVTDATRSPTCGGDSRSCPTPIAFGSLCPYLSTSPSTAMASKSKPTAPATRASTRATRSSSQTTAPAPAPAAARATRTTAKTVPSRPPSVQSNALRKPLVNRANATDVKLMAKTAAPAAKVPSQATKNVTVLTDEDREPIKVCLRNYTTDGQMTEMQLSGVFAHTPPFEPRWPNNIALSRASLRYVSADD